jgi:hypothetical protein
MHYWLAGIFFPMYALGQNLQDGCMLSAKICKMTEGVLQ